jgi:hypothetical protein
LRACRLTPAGSSDPVRVGLERSRQLDPAALELGVPGSATGCGPRSPRRKVRTAPGPHSGRRRAGAPVALPASRDGGDRVDQGGLPIQFESPRVATRVATAGRSCPAAVRCRCPRAGSSDLASRGEEGAARPWRQRKSSSGLGCIRAGFHLGRGFIRAAGSIWAAISFGSRSLRAAVSSGRGCAAPAGTRANLAPIAILVAGQKSGGALWRVRARTT